MAQELIYTSVPRGLRAGASGYCTVAQSRGLREDLAAALERRSLFAHEAREDSPVYFSFRNLSLGGATWRVLSRGQEAGLDFTGRRHYLMHHLVLDPGEDLGGVQPAEILLGWRGWRQTWVGGPEETATISLKKEFKDLPRISLPAEAWARLTGDAGWAVAPHRMASPVAWLTDRQSSTDLVRLMGESAAVGEKMHAGKSWLIPFDVGGPSNPVPRDCFWSGRTPWREARSPGGVRSVLRLSDCQGNFPGGHEEMLVWARMGKKPRESKKERMPLTEKALRSTDESMVVTNSGAKVRSRRIRILISALFFLGVVAVVLVWQKKNASEVAVEPSPHLLPEVTNPPPLPENPKLPSPRPDSKVKSPGENLRQMLWQEAGGVEKIEKLYLFFGESVSKAIVKEGLELSSKEPGAAIQVRGPDGQSLTLSTTEDREKFSRELAKRHQPWSIYLTGNGGGLAYLPVFANTGDVAPLSVGGCSPQQIFKSLGESIYPPPRRWSLQILLPAWKDRKFEPVTIHCGDPDAQWIDLFNQYLNQWLNLRQEALQQLPIWIQEDPGNPDLARQLQIHPLRDNRLISAYQDFKKLDAECRQWSQLMEASLGADEIFQGVLQHEQVECTLKLDRLVVRRVCP